MFELQLTEVSSFETLFKFMNKEQKQAIIHTNFGRVLLFHGSVDKQVNLEKLEKYKTLLQKVDRVMCCHSAFFPCSFQAKCLSVGKGTVDLTWNGGVTVQVKQN